MKTPKLIHRYHKETPMVPWFTEFQVAGLNDEIKNEKLLEEFKEAHPGVNFEQYLLNQKEIHEKTKQQSKELKELKETFATWFSDNHPEFFL